ncbi:transcription factor MYB98-like [Gastrolobium bilobum]|uniref:transcription factor MYB98-like n=1 Tax=Gastrolobium bilobum TaxID=150636 RepID=UPI002AAF108D|nr:transcription factor MYB98-like [Gastrolobium bilobum]
MDLETKLRENYASHPMHLQESYLKPSMKDELPFGFPSCQGSLQDFHHINQFNMNGFSSNPVLGVQTPNFDPFDNSTFLRSPAGFDVYECKPSVENNSSGGHAHVMDNFLYGGYSLNLPQRNQVDMMVANQGYLPFNPQETKPVNFVVPDEVSCISPMNYYKKVGVNKSNRAYPTTRRTYKVRKKSNIVKGQWTVEEDGLLIQLVEQYGLRKWSHIAQILRGRIGKQCRERWHNHLRPDIKKDTWTDEEDKILIQAHSEIGNKWAEIAKRLPGRTENSIKNHWNATKRRQYSKRKCHSKYPRSSLLQDYIKSLNLDKNPPLDYRRRSSANASSMKNKTSTSKVAALAHPQIADCSVPNYDFNEIPDFSFDKSLFEEGCSVDSLLDELDEKDFEGKMKCAPSMEGKHSDQGGMYYSPVVNFDDNLPLEIMAPMLGVEVKKELDLVEMMSQVNQIVDV